MTFEQAYRLAPACLEGALDHPKTVSDLKFAALHEIDMFEEDQDGHLTPAEIKQVRRFLARCDATEENVPFAGE